jgi:hypothetical protein
MRVSFTDQWPTFLDENGKPLIGRIKFMKADASQFKNVYYENNLGQEVYAPNPCYTLQDGRLEHQIFLDYGVYTCIVEKFIGSDWQNMRDYADLAEYWAEYKRFKAYGGEDIEGETSDLGSGFCDTIAALRTINPTEHSVVDVVGYYSKDDKIAPRTYVWVEGNGDAEDFGSTIMSSLSDFAAAGRWKLCETPVLCSTTFGVFPDRSNTITASELSQKASALAQFANASKCSEVFFPAGHYYLATGTTISFKPKVTSNGKDTNALQFDADGVQRDEEVVGTISVSFLGGLEVAQDKQLCENGSHAAFTFGAGTIKTSWLRYGTATHIHNSSAFRNIHCLLNHSASTTFCNEGDNFYNWTFEGSAQSNQYVSNGVTFVDCRFIGKCFQCGNGLTFTRCGEIRTSQFNNQIKDNSVWNSSDGAVKSEGTMLLLDGAMEMVQNYGEHSIDNRFVKVVSENGILFNRNGGFKTLKHFDDCLRFRGEIIFAENMVGRDLIVSMYYSLADCYASMKAVYDNYGVTCLIDMCGNTYSEYEVTEQSVLPFKNGSITFVCDGIMNLNIPTIHAEKAILTFSNVPSGTSFVLNAKDCEINLSDSGSYYLTLEDADCEGCTINGPMTLQNVADSDLKHRFVGCTFKSIINLDATANLTDVHCDIVITGCTFDSAYDPVMVVSNSSNFISDKYNKFIIKDNQFFGGAAMKPAHEFEGVFKSTIDGTTQAGCYTGSIVAGELRTDLYSEAFMFHVGHHSLIFEYIPYLEKTSGGGLILPQNIGVMTSELLNNVGIFLDVSNAGELQPIRILVKGKKV